MQPAEMKAALETDGFLILRQFLTPEQLDALRDACHPVQEQYGVRQVLQHCPDILKALPTSHIANILNNVGLSGATTVRSIFFNKNASHNWLVPWHQDKTICVNTAAGIAGYEKWTMKNGIVHVEPPASILENMLTWRFALDDTPPQNGALKLIPGSHRHGKLTSDELNIVTAAQLAYCCELKAGDVLLMRPLIVHASEKSQECSQRRVLHLEMINAELPAPLQWAERLSPAH
ncbi:phytanoyl-CoA dioxygenase family protein [Undibacterium sp. FT79W]|uniref:phytanoyl-CoA dioxygenase family protein n=1 Tax=Undibacterium sp. FT79W TaxID=2762296 RepID=UPI00164A255A|nr:phytanoyl-CoA dioxygenase family protein [Undibacterium sp. FT79W]MBC3879286.1 phytanoyl-CoA dioxygenase family protein [Undibacterium sp. FT79W]